MAVATAAEWNWSVMESRSCCAKVKAIWGAQRGAMAFNRNVRQLGAKANNKQL